jgi:hypothetical protein
VGKQNKVFFNGRDVIANSSFPPLWQSLVNAGWRLVFCYYKGCGVSSDHPQNLKIVLVVHQFSYAALSTDHFTLLEACG